MEIKKYIAARIDDVVEFERAIRREEDFWGWDIDEAYGKAVRESFDDPKFANAVSLLAYEGGRVVGFACLAFGVEPTYGVIEQGRWLGQGEYGFLHRVAVDPAAKGRGAAGLFFDELKRQARERGVKIIRGDTHRDNLPMQRVMAKNGLELRGVIHVEDGTERLAYECILE